MSKQIERAPAARPEGRRRSIVLDVAGGDLLLRGRFSDWESGLSLGPDLDRVGVRLAVDATSVAAAQAEAPLLSFHSRSVESTGPGTFVARGAFSGAGAVVARPLEMTVETPPGHSALFVLSFSTEKDALGEAWPDLVENTGPLAGTAEGEPPRLARAWLTTPVLAAA
jgi:hypothetical protein